MNNRDLASAQPFGEVLGTPIEPGNTVDLGRCSAFTQQGGKSHLGVNTSTPRCFGELRASECASSAKLSSDCERWNVICRRRAAVGNRVLVRSPETVCQTGGRSFPVGSERRPR